ncbi:hypothetical protein ACIBFB_09340 [Nocardiopsis sp. NPDC050513]|uniref:hypothetical protein n=1 Tax=Nocardiopsis sp. NPDC050513 TaxID=3364338 RepID=UPI003792F79A
MDEAPLYLRPRLEPPLAPLLGSSDLLHTLTDALGSPLDVLLPDRIAENAERFADVRRTHRLGGREFFAHKANRSGALVRRLAATRAGVDTASVGELRHVLGAGFTGDRIVASGPKDTDFLWLAALVGATVHIDGRAELDALAGLVRDHRLTPVRVLVRLSGFTAPGVAVRSRESRFGVPAAALDGILDDLDRHRDAVEPVGTAYHLDTVSLDEKAVALEGCLYAMNALRARGFQPRIVDVGGGFGVGYVDDRDGWDRYTTELTRAVLGERPPLTWGGHGYGLRAEGGTVRGSLGLYPAYRPDAGPAYLDALLSRTAPTLGRGLGALLLENLYDLYVEPGRALLDQCGLTLARVLETRRTETGAPMLRLAAKATDIGLEDHGVLVDPVLLDRGSPGPDRGGPGTGEKEPTGVFLTGSLCLESDLITRRRVFLPRRPRPGDLLAFANTAGYCMDFGATHAQRQPPARKVAVDGEPGRWRWTLDEHYSPVSRPEGRAA